MTDWGQPGRSQIGFSENWKDTGMIERDHKLASIIRLFLEKIEIMTSGERKMLGEIIHFMANPPWFAIPKERDEQPKTGQRS